MSLAATLQRAAAARSQAYWLLSRLLESAPDEELARESADFFSAAAGGMGPELAQTVGAFAACAREVAGSPIGVEFAVEHTRLFAGLSAKDGPPPVESAVREGRLLGGAASAVAIAYTEAGFPDPLPGAGPPDHAATQLRFLALCCHAEAKAWGAGDVAAGADWLRKERGFLEAHLAAWLPGYCEPAVPRARLPFYVEGLKVLAATCSLDLDDVREMLAQVDRETALPQVRG